MLTAWSININTIKTLDVFAFHCIFHVSPPITSECVLCESLTPGVEVSSTVTDPGVVLGQEDGETGEKHPAVHLALLLAQEEAGAGAEDHPGQVVDDEQGEQELQSVRGPEIRGEYFEQRRPLCCPEPSPDDGRVDL